MKKKLLLLLTISTISLVACGKIDIKIPQNDKETVETSETITTSEMVENSEIFETKETENVTEQKNDKTKETSETLETTTDEKNIETDKTNNINDSLEDVKDATNKINELLSDIKNNEDNIKEKTDEFYETIDTSNKIDNEKNSSDKNIQQETSSNIKNANSDINVTIKGINNVSVNAYNTVNKDEIIFVLENDTNKDIGILEFEYIVYNKDNEIILDSDTSIMDFKANSEYAISDYTDIEDDAVKVDVTLSIDEDYEEYYAETVKLYNEYVSCDYRFIETDEMKVKVQNNSDKDLNVIEIVVLYMKDNKPISFDKCKFKINAGEYEETAFDVPIDYAKSDVLEEDVLIEYDSVKFVINVAKEEW